MFDAKKLLDVLVQSGAGGNANHGGLTGIIGQVAALASQAINQGATGLGDVNRQTGASEKAGQLIHQVTGQTPADLVSRAKDFAGKNQLATGAVIGGLAAVLLGTGTGRQIIGSATRMGGLALIGGLAYKAMQNYQSGKPLLDAGSVNEAIAAPPPALPAPQEQSRALRLVRAMIAAASADGVIDTAERATILGNLQAAGLEAEAAQFIEQELANPADIPTLCAGLAEVDARAEVYAAARLAIDPDTAEERAFLTQLAQALSLEAGLISHIDAAANAAKLPA